MRMRSGYGCRQFSNELHVARPLVARQALADVFAQANDSPLQHTINTVSYLARSLRIDRSSAKSDLFVG
jgi:hypothetical protein